MSLVLKAFAIILLVTYTIAAPVEEQPTVNEELTAVDDSAPIELFSVDTIAQDDPLLRTKRQFGLGDLIGGLGIGVGFGGGYNNYGNYGNRYGNGGYGGYGGNNGYNGYNNYNNGYGNGGYNGHHHHHHDDYHGHYDDHYDDHYDHHHHH